MKNPSGSGSKLLMHLSQPAKIRTMPGFQEFIALEGWPLAFLAVALKLEFPGKI